MSVVAVVFDFYVSSKFQYHYNIGYLIDFNVNLDINEIKINFISKFAVLS